MIDPKSSDDKKLSDARELSEETSEHYQHCNDERALCARFYHNTGGVGQWREGDLEYLKRQGRQPVTHNILKTKIDAAIGMHMEQQRRAVLRAVGGEDKFKADVLSALCERVVEDCGLEQTMAKTLLNGYIMGEGNSALSVEPDSDNPAHIRVESYSPDPQEIGWDPGSMKEDRSDAGFVKWERWLTKSEFIQEYPEHKGAWDELSGGADRGWPDSVMTQAIGGEAAIWSNDDYGKRRSYYYDRKKRRALIVHIEYKCLRKDTFAIQDGIPVKLTPELVKIARQDKLGRWQARGIELREVSSEEIHAIEFCGVKILYDSYKEHGAQMVNPFGGFAIDPFIYATDSQERIPYGPARDLMPPQEELNKGVVSSSDHLVGQHKPGYMGERSAIKDPRQFEREVATTGSLAIVEDGAISGHQIEKREVPTFSPAAIQRIETSLSLIDRISGITADMEQPAALNEPATSVIMRYHKSQLGLASPRSRFDGHLKRVYRKIVEIVTRVMPDSQIQEMLGNSQKYRVENGMVINLQSNPQQPEYFSLRDLRSLKYDIELDTSTRNQTLRSLKVRQWLELHMAGIPIPPHMIAEAATDSRSEREQLRDFAKQQAAMQQQMQMQQQQQLAQQIQQTLSIEAQKSQETSRHNLAEERLKAEKQSGDLAAEIAGILERADEAEKRYLTEQFRAIQQRQTARETAAIQSFQRRGTLQ